MASSTNFFTQLEARIDAVNSHLCVGLDPHFKELFPNSTKNVDEYSEEDIANAAYTFCKNIIDATGKLYLFYISLCSDPFFKELIHVPLD
jgi:hypothetical protein